MQCPIDQTELVMSDRNDVEIDYCPKCRGVWLDRGELDKIIDRASVPPPTRTEPRQATTTATRDYRDDDDDYTYDRHGKRKKKRGGFLEELFDF